MVLLYFLDLKVINNTLAYDELVSKALKHKKKKIDIYSCSWGPSDNGHTVSGPGNFSKLSLEKGVMKVRFY